MYLIYLKLDLTHPRPLRHIDYLQFNDLPVEFDTLAIVEVYGTEKVTTIRTIFLR